MNIAICIFMSFYIIYLFLIAIIDKKYLKIDKKVNVTAARFTKSAKEKIEALGGKTEVI